MTNSVYIASAEGGVGKSAIALGLIETLTTQVGSVGVFRPVVKDLDADPITLALVGSPGVVTSYDQAIGVSYDEVNADPDAALARIVAKFAALDHVDTVVIVGSEYTEAASAPTELSFNAEVAANLNSPVVLVCSGTDRELEDVHRSAVNAVAELVSHHNSVISVLATRLREDQLDAVKADLATTFPAAVVAALPEHPVLPAPTVRQQFEAVGATLWMGDENLLDRESLGVLVAGMTLPNVLSRLEPEFTVVAAGDRQELIPGLITAQMSAAFPNQAGLILVGGYELPESIVALLSGLAVDLPIGITPLGTFKTAASLVGMEGIMAASQRKIEIARALFRKHIDADALLAAIKVERAAIRTPLMFEYQTMAMARADKKTIVLPESDDNRVLEAADILLKRDVAHLVLLGDAQTIKQQAFHNGYHIDGAQILSMEDPELLDRFAREYARLRAAKGITLQQARDKMADPSYFGTMMVHLGMADGMVSGATHTTANTIRPSLEFIKTRPGVSVVSGAFLMCMPDRVLVYADCAVNPDPTAAQLADIAISSAETAQAFGIEPRVAMLSYSTGTSGSGADVDKVREATELVKQRAPGLKVEGPIQFDAAVDPAVGQKKMPGSEVAGRATVLIFPDLNTGNNTYKAVQRTSGAVAVGPMLQGLNRPVNDLSRGALVEDIVNTVALTAIQAQALTPADKENPN